MKPKKPTKQEPGPFDPCNCDKTNHILKTASWRAFSGVRYMMQCKECGKQWPWNRPQATYRQL